MTTWRAAWVVPIAGPPIAGGWVSVAGGRILAVGSGRAPGESAEVVDLGDAAILPGLTNAHTHLELSWLRGRVPPAAALPDWVVSMMRARAGAQDTSSSSGTEVMDAVAGAIAEAHASGTAFIGDVGNSLLSVAPLCASRLHGVVFRELLGFNPADADALVAGAARELSDAPGCERIRLSLAPHAPYSTSPRLFERIASWQREQRAVTTVHLGESLAELDLLATGGGAWRDLLESLGVWNRQWTVPGCGPVEYLERLGVLDERTLVVHGVHLTDAELSRIAALGATLVTCPRSNVWVGSGDPPAARFYEAGVRVAVGTDSLASVDDLNLFAELAALRQIAPRVPARTLLRSATVVGARALGFEDAGTMEPGRLSELITVVTPRGVRDVEEYLVSGIPGDRISWICEPLSE